jgi:hypothetical protein
MDRELKWTDLLPHRGHALHGVASVSVAVLGLLGSATLSRVEPVEDLRGLMPLLEAQRVDTHLDDDAAARLVAFALSPGWSEHWARRALDWVDAGVTSDAVVEALKRVAQDKRFDQSTRHRAWRHVKHLGPR